MGRKFFVGGNFKMNPSTLQDKRALVDFLNKADLDPNTEVVVAPPSLYIIPLFESIKDTIKVGAQNCYLKESGAFTGEISPAQLHDAGVPYVILGHSERRTIFHETSAIVSEKTRAALDVGLSIILCVGETLSERESGKTMTVVESQLDPVVAVLKETEWSKIVVAYEPVWAIGTGKVATAAQAQDIHDQIRKYLAKKVSAAVAEQIRIIYGGSVNAKNCKELSEEPDIDGFLVGGASLKPEFVDIVNVNFKKN